MRRFRLLWLLVLLFVLPVEGFSQDKLCKVAFKIDGLHYWHSVWNSVELISSSDTIIEPYYLANGIEKFTIDSLPKGSYQVSLMSVFGDRITQLIDVTRRRRKRSKFNVGGYYKQQSLHQSILKDLPIGDSLQIFETQIGCFGGDKALFTILRTRDKITVRMVDGWFLGEALQEIVLPVCRLDELSRYEQNIIKHNGKKGCTTNYQYSFKYKGGYQYYWFASCQHQSLSRYLDEMLSKAEH